VTRLHIAADGLPGPHPLLEAVADEIGLPEGRQIEVRVRCAAPAGSSMGTSAAVAVAVAAAVEALVESPLRRSPYELATAAQRAEYVRCRRQCGVQDQLAAAYGGVSWIEVIDFPDAAVTPIAPPPGLDGALHVVLLGTHDSSAVHEQVIASLSPESSVLERLRRCAAAGRDALLAGDLPAFGRAMITNTEAQGELHPALVSSAAHAAIAVARRSGALGWKVNGAGGEGGSLTVLGGDARRLADAGLVLLPIALSADGVRVEVS
jgi:D-glycero-alpha-D-manno-heptose-7-phosphate kinase